MKVVIIVLALTACGKSDCAKAVHHTLEIVSGAGTPLGAPKADEQAVIDQIEGITIDKCQAEGLTPEQRDCILAMKTLDDLETVGKCPAIAAKHPSWLLAP